jgi:hypothetical protein
MAYTKTSDVAKLIRMELKQAFPGVKFSVKTRRSSAVDIDYVDGPTFSDVSEVLDKYERGTFDGMQDMYIHDKNKKGPTVDYVFVKRDYSDEKIKMASDFIRNRFKIDQETDSLAGTDLYHRNSVSSWARSSLSRLDLRFAIVHSDLSK